MTDHKITHCRSCGAPVVWMMTDRGKKMPVEPDDIDPDDELFDAEKHTSHFAECPDADSWRRS